MIISMFGNDTVAEVNPQPNCCELNKIKSG